MVRKVEEFRELVLPLRKCKISQLPPASNVTSVVYCEMSLSKMDKYINLFCRLIVYSSGVTVRGKPY